MKLAHILPLSLAARCTPPQQTVHLALVPHVLGNAQYRLYLQRKMSAGHTVILDNPVHENGEVSVGKWALAVNSLGPSITVIPDVIDDPDLTVKQAYDLARDMRKLNPRTKLMAVPHGITQLDFYACARALAKIPELNYLGISLERRLNDDERALERRYARLRYIANNTLFDPLGVHLLGTSEKSHEISGDHRDWSRATSADTSKFAVFYLCGIPVKPPAPTVPDYPGRTPFGGSMSYFTAKPPMPVFAKSSLRKNLAAWSRYAERNDK